METVCRVIAPDGRGNGAFTDGSRLAAEPTTTVPVDRRLIVSAGMSDMPLEEIGHTADPSAPTGAGSLHSRPSWEGRVVGRSLAEATKRSLNRGGALIRAAATLMERTKGDSFTVQEVANEAGLSIRSFYQHFGGKDDLLLAVYEEAMAAALSGSTA